ncbi:hypothetical protein [Flavobacterium sp.]|uniref:hypothetical protein n=1 Tax=Flavobacterium sp. TaxID=239 RepID=UPI00286CE24A|nr:hypothetical protein [Flavobacterium sp.]
MKYRDLILGVLMAVIASVIGSFIFIKLFTGFDFVNGMLFYKSHGLLGKIITLGAILNLILFFILLKFNKDLMARGVILGMIVLTVVTLLI